MRARLHVLIVLQCVVFGASCAVLLTFSVFIIIFFFSDYTGRLVQFEDP